MMHFESEDTSSNYRAY